MAGSAQARYFDLTRITRLRLTRALVGVAVLVAPLATSPTPATASGPTSGVVDSFDRADGPVGSNWTKLGSFAGSLVVAGNRATAPTGGTANFWNVAAYGPDSESYATVAALPANDGYFFGLLVRIQNGTSSSTRGGYVGRVNVRTVNAAADDWVIYKTVNGSGTIVSNGGAVLPGPKLAIGDKIMTVAYGSVPTTIELWHFRAATGTWTRVTSYLDSTNPITAAGQIGLHVRDSKMAVDDFGGGTTAAAPATSVPANVTAPTVSGNATQGATLNSAAGTWSGTPAPVLASQWERCDAQGAGCVAVPGETGASYLLTSADTSSTVRVVVTASNSAGSVSAASAVTGVVSGPVAPSNVSAPTVSGVAQQGQSLSAAQGSWSGTAPIALTSQWERCDAQGAGCAPIAGETAASYVLTSADTNVTVRVVVTASNSAGSASAASAVTAVVSGPLAPSNVSAPSVSGTAQQGQSLSSALGSWSGTAPIALTSQWERCDAQGANCAPIAGATGASYLLTSADTSSTLRVVVTATNSGGSSQAASPVTAIVTATTAPMNLAAPTISGTTQQGQTLTGTQGSWVGTPTPVLSQQWRRCGAAGVGCSPIAGATALSYQLVAADVGGTIQLLVTGTNSVSGTQAASPSSAVISGPPSGPSPVTVENQLPGTGAWYPLYSTSTGGALEGYASDPSVAPGESLQFHVSAAAPDAYRINIYRLGYYQGLGGRQVACLPSCTSNSVGQLQPHVAPDPITGLAAQGWPVTDSMTVPGGWVSGYYVAKLTLKSGANINKSWPVPFIVRQDPTAAPSRMLVVSSSNTEQAYNAWGGKSLYAHSSTGGIPAKMVSFDRPYGNQVLYFELPFLRFLESQPTLDPSYISDVDVDRTPQELLRHRFTLVNGHSEYWSKGMRDGYEAARAGGINLAFWGGDQGDWQVRYQDNWRTMVGYKLSVDPYPDPAQRTNNFSKLVPPRPQCQLLGSQFKGGTGAIASYAVNGAMLDDRYFAGTGFAAGDTFAGNGFEYDWVGPPSCLAYPSTLFFADASRPSIGPALRYTTPSGSTVFTVASEALAFMTAPADPRLKRFALNVMEDLSQ